MPGVDSFDNFLVCLAALLISSILLRMRWQSLKSLAEAQALAEDRATTDELTDLLNRRGLQHAIPGLVAVADALRASVRGSDLVARWGGR